MHRPKWRNAVGMIGILSWIFFWVALIASFSALVWSWSPWLQLPFYIIAGLAWIAPLKPVLRWMETGKLRG